MIQDGLVAGIHEGNKAVTLSKISAVVEEVLDLGEIVAGRRRSVKPMIFDLLDFEEAVAGKLREPSDRIAFLNPKLEPRKFVTLFDIPAFPDKAVSASPAPETLFMVSRKSIVIDIT